MAALYLFSLTVLLTAGVALGTVVRRGNNPEIGAKVGVPYANTSFLLNDIILEDGVLFAFSAYYLSDGPMWFQIWEPKDENNVFKLMWSTRVVPDMFKQRVDIYMTDIPGVRKPCVWVRNGYRLGVFMETVPSSVAHYFNEDEANALKHTVDDATGPGDLNQVVTFDPLPFPFDYSVSAYVKTGYRPSELRSGGTSSACPSDLISDNPALPWPSEEDTDDGFPSVGDKNDVGGGRGGQNVLPVSGELDGDVLVHWHVILGILIWLAVLTILNICLLLALCYICNNSAKYADGLHKPPQGWTDFEQDFFVDRKRKLQSLSTTELEKDFYSPDDKLHLNRVDPAKI